jgi:hypothetical protein
MSDEQGVNQISTQTLSDSLAYNSNANIIRMRLDTEPVIRQFQLDILGLDEVQSIDKESGQAKFELLQRSTPLINEKGARALVSRLRMLVNQHNSQGNINIGQYYDILAQNIDEIGFEIMINEDAWDVSPEAALYIGNSMCAAYQTFLTRPIDNLERPALQNLSTSNSSMQSAQAKKQGFIGNILGGQ